MASDLPANGRLELGPVQLPDGEPVTPYGSPVPVAWVTRAVVPDAGLAWSALTSMGRETGLVPILIPPGLFFPEDGHCFGPPQETSEADRFTAAEVLARLWDEKTPGPDHARYPEYREHLAPFGWQFPGLAPAEHGRLDEGTREQALRALPEAHVGLIRAQCQRS